MSSRVRGEDRALTFTMSGLSKIAGLPQMKLGWIVAGGDGADAAMERLELIADTYLSVATPVQVALPELLALSSQRAARRFARGHEAISMCCDRWSPDRTSMC